MKKDMFVSYQKDWEQQKVRIYDEEGRFTGYMSTPRYTGIINR